MSNRGFVKPYISISLSSQICRFVLEYSNIWQRCDSINSRFSTKQKRKADDDDDYFDIIVHRFGKSEVVQDELERYLKVPPPALSTQEALSFEKHELTCVGWETVEIVFLLNQWSVCITGCYLDSSMECLLKWMSLHWTSEQEKQIFRSWWRGNAKMLILYVLLMISLIWAS